MPPIPKRARQLKIARKIKAQKLEMKKNEITKERCALHEIVNQLGRVCKMDWKRYALKDAIQKIFFMKYKKNHLVKIKLHISLDKYLKNDSLKKNLCIIYIVKTCNLILYCV